MRLVILSCLYFLFLQACMQVDLSKPTASTASGPSSNPALALQQSAPIDTNLMRQVADDKTAGRTPPPVSVYKDPATGDEYQINSGWRIVPRQTTIFAASQPLAKAAGGLIQTWTDWSGQVETRIYECVTPTPAQHQSLGCQVEPGFMLTGGGAYADYGSGPGALLWESRPLDGNLITWLASSKDHTEANPHTLHVYAIGMRIKDNTGAYIPVEKLRGPIFTMENLTSSPAVHYPSQMIQGSPFIGGGARTNWTCCGSLLTGLEYSYPHTYSTFTASAKDHGVGELTTITAYSIFALSLECCHDQVPIPNFGVLQFWWPAARGNAVGTGVAVAYLDADPGWVITGPGGTAQWTSGPGRLLFGVKPTGTYQGQVGVFSKDHRTVSGGYNVVSFAEVQKAR